MLKRPITTTTLNAKKAKVVNTAKLTGAKLSAATSNAKASEYSDKMRSQTARAQIARDYAVSYKMSADRTAYNTKVAASRSRAAETNRREITNSLNNPLTKAARFFVGGELSSDRQKRAEAAKAVAERNLYAKAAKDYARATNSYSKAATSKAQESQTFYKKASMSGTMNSVISNEANSADKRATAYKGQINKANQALAQQAKRTAADKAYVSGFAKQTTRRVKRSISSLLSSDTKKR